MDDKSFPEMVFSNENEIEELLSDQVRDKKHIILGSNL